MIIMSVDLGKVRTGVAVCDKEELLASPVTVVEERSREKLSVKLAEIASSRKAELIIVGLPLNMDGSEGDSARAAHAFAELLQDKSGIECRMTDERGTTITAARYLNENNVRGKKRKAVTDAVAAVIILESFLNSRRGR